MSEFSILELEQWNGRIEACAGEIGLDFYPQEFELCSYEEMLGYEAYTGMPSHYPHWSYGKAYDRLHTFYRYNLTGLPYEMVINSNPCLAYLMRDNTLLLQILTIAHVYGHNDFFKNNRLFKSTRPEAVLDSFKNHAVRIRDYIQDPSIGYVKVERVLDAAHALRYQVNRTIGAKKLTITEMKQKLLEEYGRKTQVGLFGRQTEVVTPPDLDRIPLEPEEDILGFFIEYSRLDEWEKDILRIVRAESEYFLPQIETKILNEGWASLWHYRVLQKLDLPQNLHLEFLKRHHQVIRPHPGGLNPYHLGFVMLNDLETRFGTDKLFEARELESDRSFIRRYLTGELCRELHLFEYFQNDEAAFISEVADEDGWESIRDTLCQVIGMGAVPVIKVKEMSSRDGSLILEHEYDGRELELGNTGETLKYLVELWGKPVKLITRMKGKEMMIICDELKKLTAVD